MTLLELLLFPQNACPTITQEDIEAERAAKDNSNGCCSVCNDELCCCFWPFMSNGTSASDLEIYCCLASTWWVQNTAAGQYSSNTCCAGACGAACGACCGLLADYCNNQPELNGNSEDIRYGQLDAVQLGAALGAGLGSGTAILYTYLTRRTNNYSSIQTNRMEEGRPINTDSVLSYH